MKTASVAEMQTQLSTILKATQSGPVVVTRRGQPVAVLIGVHDKDEIERLLLAHSPHLQAILERSRQQFRQGQWLNEEEFWSQFDVPEPARKPAKARKKPTRPQAVPDSKSK